MDKSKQLVLSGDELTLVDEALAYYLEELTGSPSAIEPIRARGFRLMVKLSKVLGERAELCWDLKPWQIPILQRTFAPDPPAPAKRPAPKGRAKARGAASAAARMPSTPAARTVTSAAPDRGSSSPVDSASAPLTASAARRLGGLRRARNAAAAKGDNQHVSELDRRIAQLQTAAAAVHAHS